MAGYILRKIDASTWKIFDRRSDEEVGVLSRIASGFRSESEVLKMQAEASDPWLILRMVFNTEEFHLELDSSEVQRLTAANIDTHIV